MSEFASGGRTSSAGCRKIIRCRSVQFALLLASTVGFMRPEIAASQDLRWIDARELTVEGQGWTEVRSPYDRLPAKAEGVVRDPVWQLSQDSAGIVIRFRSDAPSITVRWHLTSAELAMPHMPATGVSGVDLYLENEPGQWRWVANGRPGGVENEVRLVANLPSAERHWSLYLPLYNGVKSVAVGVPETATLAAAGPRHSHEERPLVFWGTSITHGACASRPGLVHTAILGRRFDRPVINLGFSGNGQMEPEMAALVAEIDAAVFVIDCLPNLGADQVAERTEPLIRILRQARPETPIVLVEDRSYDDAWLIDEKRRRNESSRAALRAAYDRLVADGVARLYYLEGAEQLGDDSEATVDSSHPNDLGFRRMADQFEPLLRQALEH